MGNNNTLNCKKAKKVGTKSVQFINRVFKIPVKNYT